MQYGPVRRNVRTCQRCEDEPAQSPEGSVFALGGYCLGEVMPRGTHAEMVEQYRDLMSRYGYQAPVGSAR